MVREDSKNLSSTHPWIDQSLEADDKTKRTKCWRCGYLRPIFESCMKCGGSCKPMTKLKQQNYE